MTITTLIILAVIAIAVGLAVYYLPFRLWFKASVSGVDINLFDLLMLKIRNVDASQIVDAMIVATKSGLDIEVEDLERHYLAEVDIGKIVTALVTAKQGNIDLDLETASAIYLSGKDVLEAVQISINTHVINTPRVVSTCQDGIQLVVQARITVRTNIRQYIGGAGEDTILAKVGEGIVSAIGSAEKHTDILSDPDIITQFIKKQSLDVRTAYKIVSIDIADIDIGRNVGARMKMEDAKAEEAFAETKRVLAIAEEQLMRVKGEEAKVKLIEAQAQIPIAIAKALEKGNINLSDYLRYKNVEADTEMRKSFADMNTNDHLFTKNKEENNDDKEKQNIQEYHDENELDDQYGEGYADNFNKEKDNS